MIGTVTITLGEEAIKKTHNAIKIGSIFPQTTAVEYIHGKEYSFEVRTLKNSFTNYKKEYGPQPNPFSPWDKNLEVSLVNKTHALILNKYPVQLGHMLLITKEWYPQKTWLNINDWNALAKVEQDTSGLWFFNNCSTSGASQPHRHLQLLPRSNKEKNCPMEKWIKAKIKNKHTHTEDLEKSIICLERYGFKSRESANELDDLYYKLCLKAKIGDPKTNSKPKKAYNLLITSDWMSLIRRRKDNTNGFEINALGFAGYLLVTEKSNYNLLKKIGPLNLLKKVIEPIN